MNEQTIKNLTRDVLDGWNHDENCEILVSQTPVFGGMVGEGIELYPQWNIDVRCNDGSHSFIVDTPAQQSEQKTKELIARGLAAHLGRE